MIKLQGSDRRIKGLNLKATELRLGPPGSESPERDLSFLKAGFVSGAKRGFFDIINGTSGQWVLSENNGSELDLSKIGGLFSPTPRGVNICGKDMGPDSNYQNSVSSVKDDIPVSPKPVPERNPRMTAPAAKAQVVGWPPVRCYRKNSLIASSNLTKKNSDESNNAKDNNGFYVKVSMDGAPYLRKVDLNLYSTYTELSSALEKMFSCFTIGKCSSHGDGLSASKLMDLLHGSEYVVTYEDKDGDWMLVGDVPWKMFLNSCKRMRIMKSCDAIGLAPRAMEKGVSAMQMQLLQNNKIILYDDTNLGPSAIKLQPEGNCRPIPPGATNKVDKEDCWAHAIEYDTRTSEFRTLKLLTDSWCSSGGLTVDGSLISTGGYRDGRKSVRILSPCSDCDWQENPEGLSGMRWYSTQEKLEDGNFVVVGGRAQFSYEFVRGDTLDNEIKSVDLPFLLQTKDIVENNLYPFVYLLPDGSLFIFANNRAITIDPKTGNTLRNLPILPGGSRNYPASGMSVLLPLKLSEGALSSSPEVLVCGGNTKDAYTLAEKGKYLPALEDCGRIRLSDAKPRWEIEMMPSRRVMGDMLILPNAELLILNGATMGAAGWRLADKPNLRPVVYNPDKQLGQRFKEMNPTDIPRMYHASSAVLPDGKVLVAGSNTNPTYDFLNKTKFKTELRVEKFTPHYLDPVLEKHRPEISEMFSQRRLRYGRTFSLAVIMSDMNVAEADLKVTMLSPPFTTHGYSHNQRMIVLDVISFVGTHLTVAAPPNGRIAPPGYYLLHVVHRGVPSKAIWVKIH